MNQLSWLIYFAGVTDYVSGWLVAFAVVTFIMGVIYTAWLIGTRNEADDQKPPRIAWILYPLFAFFVITSTLVPSRDTVLAIAASEMGEKVLATPQAKRVGEALVNWIENQSKPAPEKRDDDERR